MPTCPQCTKPLRELVRRCPSCQADLDLLVTYVSDLQGGLERAESLTRAGELGQAIWAYLEVLEVEPDNAAARRQVSQIVTAVRQFDATTPSRRWADNLPPLVKQPLGPAWLRWTLIGTLAVLTFALGVAVGRLSGEAGDGAGAPRPHDERPLLPQTEKLGAR